MTDNDWWWWVAAKIGISLQYAILTAVVCLAFIILWAMAWHYWDVAWKFYEIGYTAGPASVAR